MPDFIHPLPGDFRGQDDAGWPDFSQPWPGERNLGEDGVFRAASQLRDGPCRRNFGTAGREDSAEPENLARPGAPADFSQPLPGDLRWAEPLPRSLAARSHPFPGPDRTGADPLGADPFSADPLRADPFSADPLRADPFSADPFTPDPGNRLGPRTPPPIRPSRPALAKFTVTGRRATGER
ncbi:MAG: hypothetical protein ACRDN0_32060 [Trebonia sp.]